MIKEMKNKFIIRNKDIKLFIFNDFCFLNQQNVSVYISHIFKINRKKKLLNYFLKEKNLNINDFVVDYKHNENCLFIIALKNRLIIIKTIKSLV